MDTSILSNLSIIDFLSATTIFTQTNAKSKKENRCNWAAVIKFEGETEYTCNGKKFISNIDNLMILPGGSSYEWVCTKEGHFAFLNSNATIYTMRFFRSLYLTAIFSLKNSGISNIAPH